jgi:hypothetical protein
MLFCLKRAVFAFIVAIRSTNLPLGVLDCQCLRFTAFLSQARVLTRSSCLLCMWPQTISMQELFTLQEAKSISPYIGRRQCVPTGTTGWPACLGRAMVMPVARPLPEPQWPFIPSGLDARSLAHCKQRQPYIIKSGLQCFWYIMPRSIVVLFSAISITPTYLGKHAV